MVQHLATVTSQEEERRREAVWRAATGEVIALATARYQELARVLGLPADASSAFVAAAMEATRQYQTSYMYANYEKRTGHPYPDEALDIEEESWAAAWQMTLKYLQQAVKK
jgi:hypothetical protein